MVWDAVTNKNGFVPTTIFYEGIPEARTEELEHFHYSYWLANIRHYSKNSPVFLVCNKYELPSGISRRIRDDMVARYSLNPEKYEYRLSVEQAYQSFIQTDKPKNEWLTQFELFQNRLVETLNETANNFTLPKYWTEVKAAIMEMFDKPGYEISKDQLKLICEKYDSSPDIDNVIIYLRDISGVILHYPDNPQLSNRVFYNPNKINKLIYRVLDYSVKKNQGRFSTEHVVDIFKGKTKQADTFIELMKELDIIFEDNQTPGHYIAPQYLPQEYDDKSKLEGAIQYADLKHAFTLKFPGFMPRAAIARFIARKGFTATDRMYWKHGILFKRRSLNSLVTCSYAEAPEIRVEIQDKDKQKRSELGKEIFLDFYEILNKKDDFEISTDGENFFAYEKVIEARQQESRYLVDSANRIEFREFSNFFYAALGKRKVRLFISYSKKNADALEKLISVLELLKTDFPVEHWSDLDLVVSYEWDETIKTELASCDAVICIVTMDFLVTDYIWNEELPLAKELNIPILPVIYDFCPWTEKSYETINKITATPKKGTPIKSKDWDTEDKAWNEVYKALHVFLARL